MQPDTRTDRLAEFLVEFSTAVRPGEVVRLEGPAVAAPLLISLERAVRRAGAQPVWRDSGSADVAIHALATTAVAPAAIERKAGAGVPEAFRSQPVSGLRWVATPVPCPVDARAAGLTLEEYADFLFRACRLDRPDPAAAWQAQSRSQAHLLARLRDARALRFVTPRGTDLCLSVTGRTWVNCAGHENLPDGEVFTAPLEDSAEGTVFFDCPAVRDGREVEGVRLVFRAGRVVEASADRGEDYLQRMLDLDEGARCIGEIAFGCNYDITRPTRHALLDEKVGGTFHLALGMAYPQSGGSNRSVLHWDLVADQRLGGRVEADGEVISADGRFIDPTWPQPTESG